MNFLIPLWHKSYDAEIVKIIQKKNHNMIKFDEIPRNFHYDPKFRKLFMEEISKENIDVVFSLQFYPIVANICESCHIPYISWCFNDRLNALLFTESVFHPCNILFLTDSDLVRKLSRAGVKNVEYLPWAVLSDEKEDTSEFEDDIALITLTQADMQLQYLQMYKELPPRLHGFLDGLMDAQGKIYGFNFIEYVLNNSILEELKQVYPVKRERDSFLEVEEQYAYQLLYPGLDWQERNRIRKCMKDCFSERKISYTNVDSFQAGDVSEMDLSVSGKSKIYLFPASRVVQNGIPITAFRIMGRGGFLLTNFQNDYLNHFEMGKEYVCYETQEDLQKKICYYLEHEEERRRIARNAYETTHELHSFETRMEEMFSVLSAKGIG